MLVTLVNAQLSKREKGKARAGPVPWASTLGCRMMYSCERIWSMGEEYVYLSEDVHWLSSPICKSEASYP